MLENINSPRGFLVLIVGPSGAGKDSLINSAKVKDRYQKNLIFARRFITRPAAAGGEKHIPVNQASFDRRLKEKKFMLAWTAHGLSYGISAVYGMHLTRGIHVVANVSRTVIEDVRVSKIKHAIIHVTASEGVLADRLRQRGRESESDRSARVSRTVQWDGGENVFTVINDGCFSDAEAKFDEHLSAIIKSDQLERL